MLYIFLILLILVFPIPIKFKLEYKDNNFNVFIYNKKINYSKSKLTKKNSKTNFDIKTLNKRKLKSSLVKFKFKKFFKPTLRVNYLIKVGLEDASNTAIFYGLLNILPCFIYKILSLIFKIKKHKFNIQPIFNHKEIYIKFDSIILANLVKVIYIILKFIILRSNVITKKSKLNVRSDKNG